MSSPSPQPVPAKQRGLRPGLLAVSMIAAIAIVTGLAWVDASREADAALHDLEAEQSVVATSLAIGLRAHLVSLERDGRAPQEIRPTELLDGAQAVEREGELTLLVAVPGQEPLSTLTGRLVSSLPLRDAIARDLPTLRLSRREATEVGLPARTAMAGIAQVDRGKLGRWAVVAVASAARERDREKRAQGRLLLGLLVASGLVLAFGGLGLHEQRRKLELARELAVAEVQRDRELALARAARLATMGTFAMGIAHEVATPLGVIVGRAEQILDRPDVDERVVRNANLIMEQSHRIQQVVRRFLDMARGGQPTLERVAPSELARAAASAVEHRFTKANVSLTTDVQESMPSVQCDRALLEHAIVNLVLNACEACPAGGHVGLAARADLERVAFVVTDDGNGISPEHAARVTEPFFTTKPAGTGTGLGLAIAAEIAKSHRGELTVGPNGSRGTRVCIEIPRS
jgi:two-component system NtrC family sensor kinase